MEEHREYYGGCNCPLEDKCFHDEIRDLKSALTEKNSEIRRLKRRLEEARGESFPLTYTVGVDITQLDADTSPFLSDERFELVDGKMILKRLMRGFADGEVIVFTDRIVNQINEHLNK